MRTRRAFTLVELLVVIGVMSVLMGLLIPSLGKAREAARRAVCASNLRQIYIASMNYAADNGGYFPPAHFDYVMKDMHRWHGTRTSWSDPFDFAASPLKKYMQATAIKQCPSFDPPPEGFELSAGGYGYNDYYLGSSLGLIFGHPGSANKDKNFMNVMAKISMIQQPVKTIMYADAAIASPTLIEYSFVEPPIGSDGNPTTPSMHFRHGGFANVIWVDGHLTSELMEWTYPPSSPYWGQNEQLHLGFFGPKDNTLFDRR